jgi:hypothetical protein
MIAETKNHECRYAFSALFQQIQGATVVKRQIRERGNGKWERMVRMEVNEA